MGYMMANGRYAATQDVTLLDSQEISADGNSDAVELGDARVLRVTLDVTAVDGEDPSLDVDVELSQDGTNWFVGASFTTATDVTSESKILPAARFARVAYDVEGEDTGTNSAVTKTGGGPTVTITGTPAADYDAVIEIDGTGMDGTRGEATFKWSIDGGETYEAEEVATSATVALGSTGLTANFATGTYELATTYAWTSDDADPDTVVTFSVSGETA